MEPVYSDWIDVRDENNKTISVQCPSCQRSSAILKKRYVTDRNEERFTQYRVACSICENTGKTYQNMNVALQSWIGKEHEKKSPHQYIHYGKEY